MQISSVKPYNFTYEMGKHMPSDTFIGEINSSQMEEALYLNYMHMIQRY